MNSCRLSFLLLLLCAFGGANAQCPTVEDLREKLFAGGDHHPGVADSVRSICPTTADSLASVYYSRSAYFFGKGNLEGAIEMGELALVEFRKAQLPEEDGFMLGRTNYNLGLFHMRRAEYARARSYYQEASRVFSLVTHEEKNKRWLRSLLDLGYMNNLLGNFEEGTRHLAFVRERGTAAGFPFYTAEANRLLGQQLLEREEWGAAAGATEVALAQLEALGQDRWSYATRINLASIRYKQGEYDAAHRALGPALEAQDYMWLTDRSRMQSLLALLALKTGDPKGAERWYEENRAIALETEDPQFIAQAYDNGAEVALKREDYPEAINRVGEAISQLVPGFRMTNERLAPSTEQLRASSYKIDLLIYLEDLARMLEAANRPADAVEILYVADGLTDEIRAGLAGEIGQLFWREQAMPVYERAIRLSQQMGESEQAFHFFEKSRAVLLLQSLAEADAVQQLPEVDASRLSRLTNQLLEQQREQFDLVPEEREAGTAALLAARDSLTALRSELAVRYPGIMGASVETGIIDEEAARTQLSALGYDRQLAYFLGEKEAFLLVLTPTDSEVISLGATDSLESAVGEMLDFFTSAGKIDGGTGDYLQAAHTAYQLLLAPAGSAPNERLLIVPDGLLAYLPFSALITKAGASGIAAAPYLLRRNLLGYAQSATVLARQTKADRTNETSAYCFAPFTEATANDAAPTLAFSQLEADALSPYLPLERMAQFATRTAFLNEAGTHTLLHLSTHAYANRSGEEPARILTADAPLYLPDIYALRLPAELVTLSACQSNIGPLARGEGVLGLGRAFTAAGARGVVASLWSLNDRATAGVITTFYEELSGGTPKPDALHRAQLAYLDRTDIPAYLKSPYYWAGLTYYGDAGTLPSGGFSWWMMGVGVLLLALGVWWWRR